jgi:hypothetical protein
MEDHILLLLGQDDVVELVGSSNQKVYYCSCYQTSCFCFALLSVVVGLEFYASSRIIGKEETTNFTVVNTTVQLIKKK